MNKQASTPEMHRLVFRCLISMEDQTKRKKSLELTQKDHVSVNTNDFTIKSNLNGYVLLHFFYWTFKLLGF